MDIYNFGEIVLEILTNGRLTDAGGIVQNMPRDALLREIYSDDEVGSTALLQEEIMTVLEVALLCTRNRSSDRPSMEDVLKLLSGPKSQRKWNYP